MRQETLCDGGGLIFLPYEIELGLQPGLQRPKGQAASGRGVQKAVKSEHIPEEIHVLL